MNQNQLSMTNQNQNLKNSHENRFNSNFKSKHDSFSKNQRSHTREREFTQDNEASMKFQSKRSLTPRPMGRQKDLNLSDGNQLMQSNSMNNISGNSNTQYASYNITVDQTLGGQEVTKWIPNDKSHLCQVCGKKWRKLTRRRHHCRSCGLMICQACSPYKDYVTGYQDQKVRVCNICMAQKIKREKEIIKVNAFNQLKYFPK